MHRHAIPIHPELPIPILRRVPALLLAGLLVLLGGCESTPTESAPRSTASEARALERTRPAPGPAAGGRHALVIGNAAYRYSPLRNPGNDARDMAAALRARGFEVDHRSDLDSARLQQAVREFSARLRARRGVGLVFFAGHGVEVDGVNYLIPVDNERIQDEIDVRQYALSVDYLLERVQAAGNPLNVVILDACRDNPFRGSTRTLNRGLRGGAAPSGTLIAYAAAPGRTADDNPRGRNGLYTEHLIRALDGGQRVEDLFQQVRRSVLAASNGRQEPWYNASLDGVYCIGGCAEVAPIAETPPAATPPLAPATDDRDRAERERLAAELQREREETERLQAELAREREQAERERLEAELAAQRAERARLEAERQRLQADTPASTTTGTDRIPDRTERDPVPSGEPDMVLIRGGTFTMGSPTSETGRNPVGDGEWERQHRVSVNDFYLAKHTVTVGEFRRFVESSGYRTEAERNVDASGCYANEGGDWAWRAGRSWRNPGFSQSDRHPVVCVSWNDALAYIEWLNEQTGQRYRLPTEAEWEYAARAGTSTARFWGNDPNRACRYANVHDETSRRVNQFGWEHHRCDDGYAQTAPVGSFEPNAWGLYDMLGNVWEWTCSAFDADYGGAETRCVSNNRSNARRVTRGGSWGNSPSRVRSAYRSGRTPDNRNYHRGFRLARSP